MKKNRIPYVCGALLAATCFASAAQAGVIISYPDFSSTAGLTFAGNAAQSGNQLMITPAAFSQSGAAYSTSPVTLGANEVMVMESGRADSSSDKKPVQEKLFW